MRNYVNDFGSMAQQNDKDNKSWDKNDLVQKEKQMRF